MWRLLMGGFTGLTLHSWSADPEGTYSQNNVAGHQMAWHLIPFPGFVNAVTEIKGPNMQCFILKWPEQRL